MLAGAHFETLLLTLGVAVIYLLLVRFLDLNEKEPLWAIGMLFVLGAGSALVLNLTVSSTLLELTVLPSAAARETARFFAVASGLGVLALLGQMRGWSEIDGVMDGLVYGACGGLGFATGEVLARDLFVVSVSLPGLEPALLTSLGRAALSGLSDGIFGAIIGAALAAALHARSAVARAALPIAGYGGAVLCHAGHIELSHGNALGGMQGLIRAWLGLLLPAVLVVLVGVFALAKEKRAIREQLAGEAAGDVVSPAELELLSSSFRRQVVYLKTLGSGRLAALLGLRALHNRQVQLALAKQRLGSRSEAAGEVDKLRAAVLELKRTLERGS
jgi:RsiW-degrading membrane proteinase PrsW (M82 family)